MNADPIDEGVQISELIRALLQGGTCATIFAWATQLRAANNSEVSMEDRATTSHRESSLGAFEKARPPSGGFLRDLASDLAKDAGIGIARAAAIIASVALWITLAVHGVGLWSPGWPAVCLGLLAGALYLWKRQPRDAIASGVALLGGVAAVVLGEVGPVMVIGLGAFLLAATILAWWFIDLLLSPFVG